MDTTLKPVLVIDPVVDVEESYRASEVVYKSGTNKSIYKYTADSASNQQIIFNNITPPSLNTIVKRDLRIEYSFLVLNQWTDGQPAAVFNSVNTAGAQTYAKDPAQANAQSFIGCAPRACPLQSASSSIELRLNGSSTSVSINDYACIYPHMIDNSVIGSICSEMPFQKDNNATYFNYTQAGPNNGTYANNNPLVQYATNTATTPRGSFVCTQLYQSAAASGGNRYAVYQFDVVEQLFISPMLFGEYMDKNAGLTNLNNLILTIRIADLNRMISTVINGTNVFSVTLASSIAVPGAPGTGNVSGAQFKTPTLLMEYTTPDPILAARSPQTAVYDYSLIQPFISSAATGTTTTFVNTTPDTQLTAQSLRLASIPSKLYIFARPSKSALGNSAVAQSTPDTFLRIKNLNINFNNRVNLLASYTESDLWSMSVRNGLKDSFTEWKYNTGSICIVDITRDIGLSSEEDVGQAGVYSTLQVTATFSASPLAWAGQTTALAYDFYVLVEQPGKAFINASECQYILTGPSAAEVLKLTSEMEPKIDHSDLKDNSIGGSVFGRVSKLLKSGVNLIKGVNPSDVSKGVEMAQNALGSLGLGVAGGAMGKKKHSRVY